MHNLVLSPIDPETLIKKISDQVTENILNVIRKDSSKNTAPNDLLTLKEAASFLNLSPSTIYSKVSKGELPVMKRSKRLYFSQIELLDYLKEGKKHHLGEIEDQVSSFLKTKHKK